jgi:hypothetical protein
MSRDALVAGRSAIAAELGCSERTVTRLYAAGKLKKAFKIGRTSPIKIGRVDLERLKKGKG